MFLTDTLEMNDEGHHRQLIATIRTPYATSYHEAPAKWERIESLIEEADRFWQDDEETKVRLEARRELAGMLNVVRRGLWIAEQADGTVKETAAEGLRVVRDALRGVEIWLEEHWDVETNTAEEFVMEKGLLRSVVLPILDLEDTLLFVDELPPGEGEKTKMRSHDEL